jgi:hypothetical protein
MPNAKDHVARDAEHAARLEIAKFLDRFKRRLYEDAKDNIHEYLNNPEPRTILDGTKIGEDAVVEAITNRLALGNSDTSELTR